MRIAHLSSVHPRDDVRIFWKELTSLASAGYDASLVVADGQGDSVCENGVKIYDVGRSSGGRLARMVHTTRRVYRKALSLNADLYHFHDPELLPVGVRLKRAGKKVIFDSHEDFPADILSKPYLRPWARTLISRSFAWYERRACRKLDHIIAATPAIRRKFVKQGLEATDVNNFPLMNELQDASDWAGKSQSVCYVGAMTTIRGLEELVEAMHLVKSNARLSIAGVFSEASLEKKCRESRGWEHVDYFGFLPRAGAHDVMHASMAGVVTFLPAPNHIDAQPNKMFEYMSAGVPVIASNFPLWKEIIEGNACGICVDPENPADIALAINKIIEDPISARKMGERGRAAVLDKYNWPAEIPKLLAVYDQVLNGN